MSKIKKAVKAVKRNLGKKAFEKANETIKQAKRDIDSGRN
jgi:phage-related protein